MLFNSIEFLFFLPVVFLIYWYGFRSIRGRNFFLLLASYVFYGWWSREFLVLIAFTTLCSWLSGILMEKSGVTRWKRKLVLWGNIAINLGILCLYKYYDFFATSFGDMLEAIGFTPDIVTLELILPVGISFYTFQALSYTIDVYRRQISPTRDPIAFFSFISFFPQLVAGPIERATNLLPQFLRQRHFDYPGAVDGCRQILWGLFKKMVIADNCAPVVDTIFSGYGSESAINLLIGAILFTFQIYGDFSGYSDIAVGTARLFGFSLMRNFNNPYFSRSIHELWKRWHISLTSWFRDYIYIPLGGSRKGKRKAVSNTFIVFLVSGLWHGAGWNFVAWGAYHAVLMTPRILSEKKKRHDNIVAQVRRLPSVNEVFLMGTTFLLVAVGWILFRSDTISDAWHYFCRMLSAWSIPAHIHGKTALLWCLVMMGVEWINRERSHGLVIPAAGIMRHKAIRWVLYFVIFMTVLIFSGNQSQFIYFQF